MFKILSGSARGSHQSGRSREQGIPHLKVCLSLGRWILLSPFPNQKLEKPILEMTASGSWSLRDTGRESPSPHPQSIFYLSKKQSTMQEPQLISVLLNRRLKGNRGAVQLERTLGLNAGGRLVSSDACIQIPNICQDLMDIVSL